MYNVLYFDQISLYSKYGYNIIVISTLKYTNTVKETIMRKADLRECNVMSVKPHLISILKHMNYGFTPLVLRGCLLPEVKR